MTPMHKNSLVAILAALSFLAGRAEALPYPLNEPLPMVGTDEHGHTYPGATVPFGMVQLRACLKTQNSTNKISIFVCTM